MTLVSRFAPSPTGPLHLGHAYAAWIAYDLARSAQGKFLVRIEDIDQSRSRAQWEAQIFDDLSWLGLEWETPVLRQSTQLPKYSEALDTLWEQDLIYPCSCNRRDIIEAVSAPQEGMGQKFGPDGLIYPGTCRRKPKPETRPTDVALRLDLAHAMRSQTYCFTEAGSGPEGQTGEISMNRARVIQEVGDVVLARRDMGTSYHLSVVVDDASQGITHVTRGSDLFEATQIHVVLQELLNFKTPTYHHHKLIRDTNGKRLAKRDDARAIAKYRADGLSPMDIKRMVGLM